MKWKKIFADHIYNVLILIYNKIIQLNSLKNPILKQAKKLKGHFFQRKHN